MKRSFFQAAVVSILLYGCTTWTLTKQLKKKLDGNYTRMLRAILNRSWQQHPTRRQLYGHLPPITKTIQAKRTRHAGHCWRSKDEIVSDVLLWTPAYGQSKAGRPAQTFIQQLCDDTGCNPEDLPKAMNDREMWRERVRDIRACRTTGWWWTSSLTFLTFNFRGKRIDFCLISGNINFSIFLKGFSKTNVYMVCTYTYEKNDIYNLNLLDLFPRLSIFNESIKIYLKCPLFLVSFQWCRSFGEC